MPTKKEFCYAETKEAKKRESSRKYIEYFAAFGGMVLSIKKHCYLAANTK